MKRRRRFAWLLSGTYVLVVAVCTVDLGVYAVESARGFYMDNAKHDVRRDARLVREQIQTSGKLSNAGLDRLVGSLGRSSGTRYTVIAQDGTVLADSSRDPARMENHRNRPEVSEALATGEGTSVRKSPTLGINMVYVAVRARGDAGRPVVVRAAIPLSEVDSAVHRLTVQMVLAGLVVAVLATGLGVFISMRIGRRLRTIQEGAERFAGGDFSYEIEESSTEEFAAVAVSLNQMARQLDGTIRTITRQRNERQAILTSMVEGVLAVDENENVITTNDAAASLLQVDAESVKGRSIQEAVRNPELQRLIEQARDLQVPVEGEIVVRTAKGDRYLQVHGTVLRGAMGGINGVVAVLNDVTRLKSLEQMRREFVANVSHEIKTPVTAIKGFAETLTDGALDDAQDAARFARIIVGQADRLNSIVEDLLALSSVEQAGGDGGLELQEASLADVLQVAVEVCSAKADAKNIVITLDAPADVYAMLNPPLLEQAVVNLIDNAIKYGPEGSVVTVRQTVDDAGIVISVRDQGVGVAREHLPHLFERFYRVDKARSRSMGGTGLGLAIVKHIVQGHGGHVSVISTPGAGSEFSIHLPLS
jgi:two-component system, OmpR family, phosphate regulon sensor histidine kinase PhoR